MLEHQITELLKISMGNISEVANVKMVVGESFHIDNILIIPICKIKYSFLACGLDEEEKKSNLKDQYPFGGGAGATSNITPIAFLVCKEEEVKVLHLDESSHMIEKIVDFIPETIGKIIKEIKNLK